MRQHFKIILIIANLLFAIGLFAQSAHDEIISVQIVTDRDAGVVGELLEVALVIDISHPWHVYAPMGNDEFTIPIEPTINSEGKPFTVSEWQYPRAEMIAVAGVEEPAAVYGGRLVLKTSLQLDASAEGALVVGGEVYYQACDDEKCLIPSAVNFETTIPVVANFSDSQSINEAIFSVESSSENAEHIDTDVNENDEITGLVDQYGMILTFFIIFLGGLALNLTPCVYPLIPITISFFGGTDSSKGRTFWMALAYVLGIAVTYSILGVAAALGGGLFGALLTNPYVLIGIAIILVGLSLSMFGVYEFRLPTGLMTAASQSKAGIFGSFFMGLTLGIVAAPCVGPFVIGLLTYVAAKQSVVLGFTMFFTLAMGLGIPYLFLAMYSSKLSSLPRSGSWMIGVRVIFGFVLIAMAIYFLMPLLGSYANPVMAIFLIGSGIYLIMFEKSALDSPVFTGIKQLIAIILVILGTWMGMPEPESSQGGIEWNHLNSIEALDEILLGEKPVMIDVYADWCIPCKEMDKFTFPDPDVVSLSQKFTSVKIDLTHQNGEFETQFLEKFSIRGVPTYLFLRNGTEISELRSTGFENAEDFLKRMQKAL